ncbi:MAG: adenosylcobinamide-GDP ribazoletransferase [Alphaproteobacteria bacterium]|nr:adenosylcobinamide-GDP ribazoletransferase [Alphaproteobacteria bacterium]
MENFKIKINTFIDFGKCWIQDFIAACSLLTVLNISYMWDNKTERPLAFSVRAFPIVGWCIGFVMGCVLKLTYSINLEISLSTIFAILSGILLTRGFHEDGLADTVDGLIGGNNKEHKLMIMKDSRIGTYGTLALIFSVIIKIFTLISLSVDQGFWLLILTQGMSRSCLPWFMYKMTLAKESGLAFHFGKPCFYSTVWSLSLGLGAILFIMGIKVFIVVSILTFAWYHIFSLYVKKQIGGYTGDILGAFQQTNEILILIFLAYGA